MKGVGYYSKPFTLPVGSPVCTMNPLMFLQKNVHANLNAQI